MPLFLPGDLVTADAINLATNAGAVTVENTSATVGTTTGGAYINNLTTAGIFGISFTVPPSGNVEIDFGARSSHSAAGGNCYTSIAVKTGSTIGSGSAAGSPTVVADDRWSVSQQSSTANADASGGIATKLVTGLTPGSTCNVALEHKIVVSGIGTFLNRYVKVRPSPSQ